MATTRLLSKIIPGSGYQRPHTLPALGPAGLTERVFTEHPSRLSNILYRSGATGWKAYVFISTFGGFMEKLWDVSYTFSEFSKAAGR